VRRSRTFYSSYSRARRSNLDLSRVISLGFSFSGIPGFYSQQYLRIFVLRIFCAVFEDSTAGQRINFILLHFPSL